MDEGRVGFVCGCWRNCGPGLPCGGCWREVDDAGTAAPCEDGCLDDTRGLSVTQKKADSSCKCVEFKKHILCVDVDDVVVQMDGTDEVIKMAGQWMRWFRMIRWVTEGI